MLQSMIVGASGARNEMLRAELADFYCNIHVRGSSMLGFDVVDRTFETGHDDSIGPLREWLQSAEDATGPKSNWSTPQ